MANLLEKASIILTPTAYEYGKILCTKPYENIYGPEEIINGDFATDSDWTKQSGWTISGGTANCNGSGSLLQSGNNFIAGKFYKITYTIQNHVTGGIICVIGSNPYGETEQRNGNGTFTDTRECLTTGNFFGIFNQNNFQGSIANVSVVEDLSGDFEFQRGSAATRVNAQGLV